MPSNIDLFNYVGGNPLRFNDPDGRTRYTGGIQGQPPVLPLNRNESFNFTGIATTFQRNGDGTFSFGKINLWEQSENGGEYNVTFPKPVSVLAISNAIDPENGKEGHFAIEVEITGISEGTTDTRLGIDKKGAPSRTNAARLIFGRSWQLDKSGNRVKQIEDFRKSGRTINREGDNAEQGNGFNFVTGTQEDHTSQHGSLMNGVIKNFEKEK